MAEGMRDDLNAVTQRLGVLQRPTLSRIGSALRYPCAQISGHLRGRTRFS
jgi:hypothetical protein